MSSRKLPKGTMIRCVVCDGEREAYKDCASCANKRAAGHIPPEMTSEQSKAARRASAVMLATSDAFPESSRRHVASYLYDQATKLQPGRTRGAIEDRTWYIVELIAANPTFKPLALWKVADKKRAGEKKSFLKRASEYRNKK